MSLINLIMLSTTPVVGLGFLLGIGRFEQWALNEHPSADPAPNPVDVATEALSEAVAPELQPQPVHRAAA